MKILGVDFDFSFTNGDNVKKFEDNYDKVLEKTSSFTGEGKLSTILLETCEVIDEFFDKVFGEGTSKKLFKNNDLKYRIQAFKEMKEARDKQEKEYNELINTFNIEMTNVDSKYSSDRAKR